MPMDHQHNQNLQRPRQQIAPAAGITSPQRDKNRFGAVSEICHL
jgi:hypothetical protein